jgi:DNA-binding response OmpR family regulator
MTNSTETILIVDDDDNLRNTLALILQKAGYSVTTAENATTALHILEAGAFDLVFLDLKMPGMDGSAMLEELQRLYPDMPVCILTAHASLDTSIHAVRFGARDYMLKPMNPEEVLERVEDLLARKEHPRHRREIVSQLQVLLAQLGEMRTPVSESEDMVAGFLQNDPMRFLRRGQFVLDLQSRRVTFIDQVLELSPSTFEYLAALIRHAPNPVSYETLVMEAQGYHLGSVEVRDMARWRIHELRAAIEPDPETPKYVITVRGFGYKVVI